MTNTYTGKRFQGSTAHAPIALALHSGVTWATQRQLSVVGCMTNLLETPCDYHRERNCDARCNQLAGADGACTKELVAAQKPRKSRLQRVARHRSTTTLQGLDTQMSKSIQTKDAATGKDTGPSADASRSLPPLPRAGSVASSLPLLKSTKAKGRDRSKTRERKLRLELLCRSAFTVNMNAQWLGRQIEQSPNAHLLETFHGGSFVHFMDRVG